MKKRYIILAKIVILITINAKAYTGVNFNERGQLFFKAESSCPIKQESLDNKHYICKAALMELKNSKNEDSQIDSIVNYSFISQTDSLISSKRLYSYDDNDNLKSILIMEVDYENQNWVYYRKIEYDYDIMGNTVLYKLNSWDTENNRWNTNLIIEYDYNSQSLLVSETIFFYFRSNWDNPSVFKNEYQYNDLGHTTLITGYKLEDDNWINYDKEEYEYGSCDSLVINVYYYDWDRENGEWSKYGKRYHAYNSQGKRTLIHEHFWDNVHSTWSIERKALFEYCTGGYLSLIVSYLFDDDLNTWHINDKVDYDYNNDGKLTLMARYDWDSYNELWSGTMKREYVYDNMGKTTIMKAFDWREEDHSWQISNKDYYYWAETFVNVAEVNENNIIVYPNPAKNYININGIDNAVVEIYDINGRCLLREQGVKGSVDIRNLPSATYILRVRENNSIKSQRFIKH